MWTATTQSGAKYADGANSCASWTATEGISLGIVGIVNEGVDWTLFANGEARSCDKLAHLYCFEVVP